MLTNVRLVGFTDVGGLQKCLIGYPTEVIYLRGVAHKGDSAAWATGSVYFHDEAHRLPAWCKEHGFTYYSGEGDIALIAGVDG